MAKKKSLFEAPPKTSGERESDYERLKADADRKHGQKWSAFNAMPPNLALPWWGQVLDLEARGKHTTPAAHDLATAAKARADARNWKPQRETVAEPPGDWSDMEDNLPWEDAK